MPISVYLRSRFQPTCAESCYPSWRLFRAFPAQGPEGIRSSDINRRAAAIECYLDLDAGDYPSAKVLWTNYKRGLGVYQGALEYKDSYVREFLKQTHEAHSGRIL